MELPGIPDAKEPDGPEDGIVVLEKNLGAAIEVTLDQEVKVLYPGKSWIFGITGASDKLMKVHCRDDPSIFGTRRVEDGLTLGASESFGSFGVEVADFLQKDREEVEREKSLLQERKRRMEKELEKQRRIEAFCRFPFFPSSQQCTWASWCYGRVWTPKTWPPQSWCALAWCCRWLVCAFTAALLRVHGGLSCPGPRRKVLVYYAPYGCFFLGSLTVTVAIVRYVMAGFWWTTCWQLGCRAVACRLSCVECCCVSPPRSVSSGMRGRTRRQLPIGPSCSKAKFVQAPANAFAHGQANTSLLGMPWSQAAAVVTSARRWSFYQRVQRISAATTLFPEEERLQGSVLVRSPLWGEKAVGLPLVDKVDCKHRKCAQRRRGNGGLLLQRHEE